MPIHKEFDKEFFKRWSPDMAYILGFLFADGNIIKTKRNTHFVAIYTSDRELLVSMAQSMGSDHKISERRTKLGGVYVLQIGSRELFDNLVKLGLTPNKSRRMRLPKIPKKYVSNFIRGYFDGDGNVWSGFLNKERSKPTHAIVSAFTCACKNFLIDLRHRLRTEGIIGGSIYMIKAKNCYRLSLSTFDSLKLFKIMYTVPHKLFLHRKKLIFERFAKMRP